MIIMFKSFLFDWHIMINESVIYLHKFSNSCCFDGSNNLKGVYL